jgi:hypothetical protein
MNNQEILDNAPEGATTVCDTEYWNYDSKHSKLFSKTSNEWVDGFNPEDCYPRSLFDIKRIAELEKEKMKLLECFVDISESCIGAITMSYTLDAHCIGQGIYQATGMTTPQLHEWIAKGGAN